MLDTSVAAVNSSLQRARAQLDQAGLTEDDIVEPTDPAQRELLDRYARALEAKDIAAIVEVFTDDAVWEMPPFVGWYQGAGDHRPADRHALPGRPGGLRMVPDRGQRPARVRACTCATGDGRWHAFQLQVMTLTAGRHLARHRVLRPQPVPDLRPAGDAAGRRPGGPGDRHPMTVAGRRRRR